MVSSSFAGGAALGVGLVGFVGFPSGFLVGFLTVVDPFVDAGGQGEAVLVLVVGAGVVGQALVPAGAASACAGGCAEGALVDFWGAGPPPMPPGDD